LGTGRNRQRWPMRYMQNRDMLRTSAEPWRCVPQRACGCAMQLLL